MSVVRTPCISIAAATRLAMVMPCTSQSCGSLDAAVVRARQRQSSFSRTHKLIHCCDSDRESSSDGSSCLKTACSVQRMMLLLNGVPVSRSASSASFAFCSAVSESGAALAALDSLGRPCRRATALQSAAADAE